MIPVDTGITPHSRRLINRHAALLEHQLKVEVARIEAFRLLRELHLEGPALTLIQLPLGNILLRPIATLLEVPTDRPARWHTIGTIVAVAGLEDAAVPAPTSKSPVSGSGTPFGSSPS